MAPTMDKKLFPLTQAQRRIWYTELLYPDTTLSMMAGTMVMRGSIDASLLMQAVQKLIKDHDAFRIRITEQHNQPMQWFEDESNIHPAIDYLEMASRTEAEKWMQRFCSSPINMFEIDKYKIAIMKINDEEYWFNLKVNHIIADGVSMYQLCKFIMNNYMALKSGINPLPVPKGTYMEYIHADQDYMKSERYRKDKCYWMKKFETLPEVTGLKHSSPDEPLTDAKRISVTLTDDQYRRLRAFSEASNISAFVLFLTSMYLLLYKHTGNVDVPVGTVFANRTSRNEKEALGMFVSTVATRLSLDPDQTLESLLHLVFKEQQAYFRHQKYPYNHLIQDLRDRDAKRDMEDLFRVSLNYAPIRWTQYGDISVQLNARFCGHETNDFFVHIEDFLDLQQMSLHADYRIQLFKEHEIERIMEQLLIIADQILSNPQQTVRELSIVGERELSRLLTEFNPHFLPHCPERLLHQAFEEQAKQNPDHEAIICIDKKLTYKELNEKGNQLARTLQAHGIGRASIVGILADRSVDMLIGVLAVWKAGGAYVPIDADYPEERIQFMIVDSGATLLLTQSHFLQRSPVLGEIPSLPTVLCMDDGTIYNGDNTNLPNLNEPSDLAYVIYTSGTTGRPKGVMIEHSALTNTAEANRREYGLDRFPVKLLQLASFSFDVFVGDIARTLYNGGTMIICPAEDRVDPSRLNGWIQEFEITIFEATPALIIPFMNYAYEHDFNMSSMRLLIVSSDSCSINDYRTLQERYGSQFRIINSYGVTEAAIDSSYYDEPLDLLPKTGSVPIGKAWMNARFYIVDRQLNPVPIGMPGELCIGGPGVARGYLNLPDMSEEKFVPSPFVPGERLYRTGDLAQWMVDGNVDLIGRIDFQVKIRGFRIELGEIEAAMLAFPGVRQAVVIDRMDSSGENYLIAYVVSECSLDMKELRCFLKKTLPTYMIPARFLRLDRLPLTFNGKINRNALPTPKAIEPVEEEHEVAETPLEIRLVDMWKQMLGVEQIGVKQNFFDIGGHSLRATMLVSRINKELQVNLPLRDVFRFPTIKAMAQAISELEQRTHKPIPVTEKKEYYAISSAQKRLYTLHQFEGADQSYNMSGSVLILGSLCRKQFEKAFRDLIARHETLRTGFELVDGEPMQCVHDEIHFEIEYMHAGEEEAAEIENAFIRAFDLSKPPLMRVGLAELKNDRHLFLFDMHHIISDGVSTAILVDEFSRLYGGEELMPLRIQFKDYVAWQMSEAQQEEAKLQEAYWLSVLERQLPVLEMPTDYARPAVRSFEGDTHQFELDAETSRALVRLSSETGTTLFMVLFTIYVVMLHKYSGQEDIVVGTPIAGRTHEDLQPLIGMFVNTLAIRSHPSGDKTFLTYLEEIKETTLVVLENQSYPFAELVEKVLEAPDKSRNPIFDTMFVLQNTEEAEVNILGLRLKPQPSLRPVSKFDLTFQASEEEGRLVCSIEYSTALYKQETIKRMAGHFKQLVSQVINHPKADLASLQMLTPEESALILSNFNGTEMEYARERTIHQLFEEQAVQTPNSVAVEFEGLRLTYRELNEKANSLARTLQSAGVVPDARVGIMVERSIEMIISILAILKAGGAYLPIDPDYPQERVQFMLEDSGAQIIVGHRRLLDSIQVKCKIVALDDPHVYSKDMTNLESVSTPCHLAYVIYTSGTTGKPKGILTTNRNVVHFVHASKFLEISEEDRILQLSSFSFDGSIFDIFGTLLNGARLILIPQESVLNIEKLAEQIERQQITRMVITTALFHLLVDTNLECLRHMKSILVGGERASVSHVRKALNRLGPGIIKNIYGPTEATVFATYHDINEVDDNAISVPIGKPISNTSIYIVNERNGLQPIGMTGEICIAGDGIARGYLNRPDLTSEKFVDHPFSNGNRMYRTGDLGKWMPDGTIEYVGRRDDQVKIRGFRIELGEVEAQLLTIDSVREAFVIAQSDESGAQQLCAYVVADRELTGKELRSALSDKLPAYMIPSYFSQVAKMPLTTNGKVDRRALDDLAVSLQHDEEHVAPRTETETQVARIWQDVLGLPGNRIGVKDNFFEIGGHSLRASTLVSKLHKEMRIQLPLRDVFQYPTIEQMAETIKHRKHADYDTIPRIGKRNYYSVSSAQKRLYVLQQLEGGELNYNMPTALEVIGLIDRERLEAALQALIARHEPLRTSFHIVDGKPVQRIHANTEFELACKELIGENTEELIRSFIRPFDLGQAPLLRAALVKLEPERHLLLLDMHHIISDGTSVAVITEELTQLYAGNTLLPLQLQYKEYAAWQQTSLRTETIKQQEQFWMKQFTGEIPVLNLPTDFPRPALRSYSGGCVNFLLDEEMTRNVKRLARQTNTTIYMVLVSIYGLLLSKLSNQEEVIVGTPVAGRSQADTARMVGMFVNTLALRMSPSANQSFAGYLQVVKQSVLGALEHQDYPFEELVQRVAPPRELSRNPIFDAMFILQNMENAELALDGASLRQHHFDYSAAKFDVTLSITETDNGLHGNMEYASALFAKDTADRWISCYIELLRQAISNPDMEVRSMGLMNGEEQKRLCARFAGKQVAIQDEQTIHGLFERQAARTPDQIALICNGEQMSYEALNRKAAQLAHAIRSQGVSRNEVVAVLADRSILLVASLLAVGKAGAAYLPLDPLLPEERIASIIHDSGCRVVVTDSAHVAKIPDKQLTVLLDRLPTSCEEDSLAFPCSSVSPSDLAYVIYTSGSTGKPKGVMIEHRSVHNLLVGIIQEIPLETINNVLSLTTVSFDIFVLETLLPLMLGCTVVMATHEEQMELERLAHLCQVHRIELLQTTPARLRMLLDNTRMAEALGSLRYMLIGGEALTETLLHRVRTMTSARLFNMYGPTETTVWSTVKELTHDTRITIGRPIANTRVYIMNDHGLIQPVGIEGELCIAGKGLARGYMNNRKLTAERFVQELNGDHDDGYGKMYRTGDRARYLNDGTIEYLGRLDDQVKIRGNRVEPGEIAAALSNHPSIRAAVVVDGEEAGNSTYLIAYYESAEPEPLPVSNLREYLGGRLPAYMIPSFFVQLNSIPMNSNGKVNKHALPLPNATKSPVSRDALPRNEGERMLADMWKEVLDVREVGRNDNFFELGGHSLHAALLVERIRRERNSQIKLTDFFMHPTIASLASRLFEPSVRKERIADVEERVESRKSLMKRQRDLRGKART